MRIIPQEAGKASPETQDIEIFTLCFYFDRKILYIVKVVVLI